MNKEIKDFFMSRINEILDRKEAEIYKDVPKEQIVKSGVDDILEKYAEPNLRVRIETLVAEKDRLEKEITDCNRVLGDIATRETENRGYWGNPLEWLANWVERNRYPEILKKNYPEASAKLNEIKKMRDNIHGVILLATTEKKIVEALRGVAEKYGDTEIAEIIEFIEGGG